jgi:hypothetical protein
MVRDRRAERGVALVYVGIFLVVICLVVGLAVDLGRAYAVRLRLATAVDAAALAAARTIPNGESPARTEAEEIFALNFPADGLVEGSEVPTPTIEFGTVPSGPNRGAHLVTVSATIPMPTTFMRVRGYDSIDVAARGQATRRLVDLSFVIDHSASLGSQYGQVQSAANQFVDFFDEDDDRVALVFFASDAIVADSINDSGRGFDKGSIQGHINDSVATGKTATAEGLFRGWDQLRLVPPDMQSGVRVIVLFTDGAPNTFSGTFRRKPSRPSSADNWVMTQGAIRVSDFPGRGGLSRDNPQVMGLSRIETKCCRTLDAEPDWLTPGGGWGGALGNVGDGYVSSRIPEIPHLPNASAHPDPASNGMPTSFLLEMPSVPGQRTLLRETTGRTDPNHIYPSHAQNVAKASRNLAETIAYEIRNDASGEHRIHIFTLGLGDLLNQPQGYDPMETGSSILERIANDPASADFDEDQPEGKYYFAGDASQLQQAFQQVRDRIIRLTQ